MFEVLARPHGVPPEALAEAAPLALLAQQVELAATWSHPVLMNVEPVLLNERPREVVRLLSGLSGVGIEVTERGLLGARAIDALTSLREAGVDLWLDDFGTGDSTWLGRKDALRANLITGVKLPPGALVSAVRQELPESVLLLCEGLEDMEQALTARAQGAALFQGYVFGAPLEEPGQVSVLVSGHEEGLANDDG
jgi:EAL domain-containing protein (putative c-di-GMP-specific phosphodiesterase class I)